MPNFIKTTERGLMQLKHICHTDVEILRGNYPTRYPVVPGHEFAGTVEAVGPGLSSDWVGRRIVVDPNRPCRDCPAVCG